jgi:hypothetical protein
MDLWTEEESDKVMTRKTTRKTRIMAVTEEVASREKVVEETRKKKKIYSKAKIKMNDRDKAKPRVVVIHVAERESFTIKIDLLIEDALDLSMLIEHQLDNW